jgi:hypothetical protein
MQNMKNMLSLKKYAEYALPTLLMEYPSRGLGGPAGCAAGCPPRTPQTHITPSTQPHKLSIRVVELTPGLATRAQTVRTAADPPSVSTASESQNARSAEEPPSVSTAASSTGARTAGRSSPRSQSRPADRSCRRWRHAAFDGTRSLAGGK